MGDTKPAATLNLQEFKPQPGPQSALLSCPIEDVLFGGAVGGGKTFGMLLDWLDHAITYGPRANGLFVRRVGANLAAVISMSLRIFPHFGGVYRERSGWKFMSGPAKGARLNFKHMWDLSAAILQFQGDDYTWVCVEEMGQYPTSEPIDYLKTRMRSSVGVTPMFRATANPGGAGHGWIKARYVTPHKAGYKVITDPRSGERRVFIPSRLEDNRILTASDPKYESRLKGLGPPNMVKALRYGDWDSLAGAFFSDVINLDRQRLKPFAIPASWTRRRSFDWGSTKPASVGYWAISDGTQPVDHPFYFPRGSAIRTGERYTVAHGDDGLPQPNVGLRLMNDELGRLIAQDSLNTNWNGCVADPSIFTRNGGPSIFDQMNEGAKKIGRSLIFRGADNSRVPGWQRMRSYLEASATGDRENPGLYVFENCTDWFRTVPDIQMDKKKPDDIDTESEDHCFTGETMVMTDQGARRIDSLLGSAGMVIGADGEWHKFESARLTRRQTEIVELSFSDGSKVRCTPDHLFLKSNGDWCFAKDMAGQSCHRIDLCTSQSSRRQFRNLRAFVTTSAGSIFKRMASGFIGSFTSAAMAKSRSAATFIIATMIDPTTIRRTSPSWMAQTTPVTIQSCQGLECATSTSCTRLPVCGMDRQKAGLGTLNILQRTSGTFSMFASPERVSIANSPSRPRHISRGTPNSARTTANRQPVAHLAWTMLSGNVWAAARSLLSTATARLGHARNHAPAALQVVCVAPAGVADVFCLTVPTSHSFTLESGAVVHNCSDDSRYLLQSLTAAGGAGGATKIPTKGR